MFGEKLGDVFAGALAQGKQSDGANIVGGRFFAHVGGGMGTGGFKQGDFGAGRVDAQLFNEGET